MRASAATASAESVFMVLLSERGNDVPLRPARSVFSSRALAVGLAQSRLHPLPPAQVPHRDWPETPRALFRAAALWWRARPPSLDGWFRSAGSVVAAVSRAVVGVD